MWLVRTTSTDVHRNLAVEEHLAGRLDECGTALFFYRNASSVVFGKNQNPWQEFDVDTARAAGACLARRISGGGTVWHDEGNLNFSLILPRARYDLERQFALIRQALREVGVDAEVAGRTNLLARGFKFSGNSFSLRGVSAIHHGTLLLNGDLVRLRAALRPPPWTFSGPAIRSVPARVANLCELYPGLEPDAVEAAFVRVFAEAWGGVERVADDADIEAWPWRERAARNASWAWVFGETPRFEVCVPVAGGVLRVTVEEGIVRAVEQGPPEWVGLPFDTSKVWTVVSAIRPSLGRIE